MLKSFLKSLGYTWKRFRKSLKKRQNKEEYNKKVSDLKTIMKLYKSKYIDLFFADESGFNLEAYVPYGWEPKGKYIEITPQKTTKTNIFGLMSLDNILESYSFVGKMNSQMVIAFLDDFKTNIKKNYSSYG